MNKRTIGRTKCQLVDDCERAYDSISALTPEAAHHEQLGWDLAIETAPSCDDPDCCVCRALA